MSHVRAVSDVISGHLRFLWLESLLLVKFSYPIFSHDLLETCRFGVSYHEPTDTNKQKNKELRTLSCRRQIRNKREYNDLAKSWT